MKQKSKENYKQAIKHLAHILEKELKDSHNLPQLENNIKIKEVAVIFGKNLNLVIQDCYKYRNSFKFIKDINNI